MDCGPLHETNPSLPFSKLKASLYDDCDSSLPLESNFVYNTPLTDLEEAFDPPLTSLPPLVALSSSRTPTSLALMT